MKYLFDSNILIYHLNGQLNQRGTDLLAEGLTGEGAYSIVTKIELLGFNQTDDAEQQARLLLSSLQSLDLSTSIAEQTIQIRKTRKLKLPDAIIAATALDYNLTLTIYNIKHFQFIKGLKLLKPDV